MVASDGLGSIAKCFSRASLGDPSSTALLLGVPDETVESWTLGRSESWTLGRSESWTLGDNSAASKRN
jgi:hypothetical protein